MSELVDGVGVELVGVDAVLVKSTEHTAECASSSSTATTTTTTSQRLNARTQTHLGTFSTPMP